MSEKDIYIRQLEDTIKDLKNQVSSLSEMILLLRKGKFGSSSEKTPKKKSRGSFPFLTRQRRRRMLLLWSLSGAA